MQCPKCSRVSFPHWNYNERDDVLVTHCPDCGYRFTKMPDDKLERLADSPPKEEK